MCRGGLSEERYRYFFERMADAAFITDMEGNLLEANQSARKLTQSLADTFISQNLVDMVRDEEGKQQLRRMLADLGAGKSPEPASVCLQTPDARVMMEVNATHIAIANEPATVLWVCRDITKRMRVQQKLFQASKLISLGELASGIAHEINNPLMAVLGFAELALEVPEIDPQLKEYIEHIMIAAERVQRIVRSVMRFASDRKVTRRQVCSLNDVVEITLGLVETLYTNANISLQRELSPDLPPALANRGDLQEVLLSLIQNAKDAITMSHKGSTITVRTRAAEDGGVLLEVEDDGPGIAPEHLDRVFDHFFTTKDSNKATGLGLATVAQIVSEHNGSVSVVSEPNGGAKFTIKLPAC